MASVSVKTSSGGQSGTVELDDAIFGIAPNVPVMHQVVTAQLAARRAGTQSTLTRAEVRGGGAKPWRQKGTGRSRQGSIRSPQWRGGGVALGPKPRSYRQKTPRKMIRLALRSALSDRAAEGKVVVVDELGFDAPRTMDAVATLEALGAEGRVLLVVPADDRNVWLSFRNLDHVHVIDPSQLNAYDVLVSDVVVFTRATVPTATAADRPSRRTAAQPTPEPSRSKAKPRPEKKPDPEAEAPEAEAAAGEPESAAPYGEGSAAALDDGAMPDGFPIKGNANSMKYHEPGTRYYDKTIAEVWFATAADAEKAGFTAPGGAKAASPPEPAEEPDTGEEPS